MYHCQLQFYLVGEGLGLFGLIRATPPLEHFSHTFTESARPDPALAGAADVIFADLRGADAPGTLGALLAAKRDGAELVAVADGEQFPHLRGVLPGVSDVWPAGMGEEEARASRPGTSGKRGTSWTPPSTACPTSSGIRPGTASTRR